MCPNAVAIGSYAHEFPQVSRSDGHVVATAAAAGPFEVVIRKSRSTPLSKSSSGRATADHVLAQSTNHLAGNYSNRPRRDAEEQWGLA